MLKYILPLLLFIVLAVFLAIGLKLNPRDIPSPLINQPAPDFLLPVLDNPQQKLSPKDLKGKVWLLNVWASWCVSCRSEHPVLNEFIKRVPVTIIGLNYKDDPQAARQWLAELGNPYQTSVMDQEGRTGIDYGVYGVPETFVIDKKGIIRFKFTGPVTMKAVNETFLPLLQRLEAEAP
jgi:cytochrome c biogenesis protein CcmG/thiol:disulfide interchange protein DsbE